MKIFRDFSDTVERDKVGKPLSDRHKYLETLPGYEMFIEFVHKTIIEITASLDKRPELDKKDQKAGRHATYKNAFFHQFSKCEVSKEALQRYLNLGFEINKSS